MYFYGVGCTPVVADEQMMVALAVLVERMAWPVHEMSGMPVLKRDRRSRSRSHGCFASLRASASPNILDCVATRVSLSKRISHTYHTYPHVPHLSYEELLVIFCNFQALKTSSAIFSECYLAVTSKLRNTYNRKYKYIIHLSLPNQQSIITEGS